MKRKLLSILLTLCLAFSLLPTAALAEGETAVAKVGDVEYPTLAEAVAAVADGGTVTLLKSATGGAVGTFKGAKEGQIEAKSFTIDFGGYTYTVTNPAVGSTGYESQAFHLERSGSDAENHKVTFKNGTITTAENFGGRMLIQNYCDLTLENMTIIGDSKISYVISNNFGSLTAKGDTVIKAADGKVAFDLWYGMNSNGLYDDGVSVTFGTDFTGSVTGKIEYGAHSRVTSNDWKNKAKLTIANGNFDTTFVDSNNNDGVAPEDFNITITGGTFTSDVSAYVPDRYIYNSETKTVEPLGETNAVAKVGDTYYKTLADAVAAAKNGGTIDLLSNVSERLWIKNNEDVTINLNGYTISSENQTANVRHGKLTVNGPGTIKEDTPYFGALLIKGSTNQSDTNYAVATINKNVTLEGWAPVFIDQLDSNNAGKAYGITVNLNGAVLNGKRDSTGDLGSGIYVNGTIKDTTNAPVINLDSTTVTSEGQGMYLAGYATTTVNGGSVSGSETGIEIRAGKLTVNGATVNGNGIPTGVTPNGNGSTTVGAGIAVAQHTTKLPIDVTISDGTISGYTAFYESNPQNNAAENLAKINIAVKGGEFKAINGGTNAVYSQNKTGFISGGYFTSDPSSYKAADRYVVASDVDGYTYMVTATAPTDDQKITVVDKTNASVDPSITGNDKTAIESAMNSGKTNVDGVAEAVSTTVKTGIVNDAKNKANNVPGGEVTSTEIEVKVNVSVTEANLSEGSMTFKAEPVANVKVNGTELRDSENKPVEVPVSNAMLNGKPITVKLPLPTVDGNLFTPKQIKHTSSDGSVEYFLDTQKTGAKTFEIKDGCAVFTITKFSKFELSGTVTYVEPSYYSGSSSYDPTYSVSTPSKTEHGSVTVSPKSASKGDTVTVTVKPDSGYVLETLTVTDKNGNELTLKDKGNGKYTFTMPAGKVEVKATFMEDNSMLNFFYDVPNNAYFYEAVKWAVKNGITTGVGNNLFAPEQPCTRAQIVTFLWRAAGSPEPKGAASGMTDVVSGGYYEKAVAWAIENGITTGTTTSTFSPDATCTRAQAVTFLARALKAKAASAAEFSDVPTGSYFADAVAWAAANGVTEGIGGGLFGSDNDCTRGQIVTFLYRAYNK